MARAASAPLAGALARSASLAQATKRSASRNGGDAGGIAAASCLTWLSASGAGFGAARRVVAAKDESSALRDFEMRFRGDQLV